MHHRALLSCKQVYKRVWTIWVLVCIKRLFHQDIVVSTRLCCLVLPAWCVKVWLHGTVQRLQLVAISLVFRILQCICCQLQLGNIVESVSSLHQIKACTVRFGDTIGYPSLRQQMALYGSSVITAELSPMSCNKSGHWSTAYLASCIACCATGSLPRRAILSAVCVVGAERWWWWWVCYAKHMRLHGLLSTSSC